jgi:hypothetical protein
VLSLLSEVLLSDFALSSFLGGAALIVRLCYMPSVKQLKTRALKEQGVVRL